MMKSRNLFCLLFLAAALVGPGTAAAVDDPATGTDSSSDTPSLTLDQNQIDALAAQANQDDDKSVFEKASDFVTDNAPWFIIGIIVVAAIIAGILIMRGRPAREKPAGGKGQPAQVPSASELRRRKRAAIQRSREEERMRRKAGIESRRTSRRGEMPPAAIPGEAAAASAAGVAASGIDPVEAEKQGARDQETAAAAMARFGASPDPLAEQGSAPAAPAPAAPGAVPAPVSPSQTAPAAGVVTPGGEPAFSESDTRYQPAEPPPPAGEFEPVPEGDTSILHEPSIENPGADAAVGNAARDFLAGGAVGAAGGIAAARSMGHKAPAEPSAEQRDEQPEEQLDPVIAPEPGMAPEHALADPPAAAPEVEGDERLRAKLAEIKEAQGPEPAPRAPDTDLSPGLAAVERKLSENSEERDRALREAEERLRRVEQRAEDAERRAAFAERLAQLKVEESERERRLNDVVSGIDRAEQRAREAEERAEAAERAAAAALEQSDLKPSGQAPAGAPPADDPQPPETEAEAENTRASEFMATEVSPPERKGLFGGAPSPPSAAASDAVNLNSATFEELREAGLSVTQATRILAYRERFGGYAAVEDLEKVPGFPSDLIESLQGRLTI